MSFTSILFRNAGHSVASECPDCFSDLHLDQIVSALIAGKDEYALAPLFHTPLHDRDAVTYRQEVMRDLEESHVLEALRAFAGSMHLVREYLAQLERRFYERQKDRWFLDAVEAYAEGVRQLSQELKDADLASRGLSSFRNYLAGYASSGRFLSITAEANQLKVELSAIRYNICIRGSRLEVTRHFGEGDYSAEVADAFARFRQGAAGEYKFQFGDSPEMNHIEAQILEGVAFLHPQLFSKLGAYRKDTGDFRDHVLITFDREIQFYISYCDYIAKLRDAGLHFCYPTVSATEKEFRADGTFDLSLAAKLYAEGRQPVTNDLFLQGDERIIVVSGPNQGGKTTTARAFGQLHYIGALGLPVPGKAAHLFLPDRIFTHFEREERVSNLRGKLQDDLLRARDILSAATSRSIVIINEIFASTTLHDAVQLSRKIGARLMELDVLCIWVTFIDEVASLGPRTVSMVADVVPEDPAQRTFKVVRRPADGLAYALTIAEKYGLTYAKVLERVRS